MKAALLKASALSLLLTSTSFAQDFNGYIVKIKNTNFLSEKSVTNAGTVSEVSETSFGTFAKLDSSFGLHDKSIQNLANHPDVEYIEPNYIVKVINNIDVNDASFDKQWGLNNTGNGGIFSPSVKGEDINALKAWSITQGSKDIKIAVIDTGVNYNHPDLKNQMDVNTAELNGTPGVDDDGNGYVDDIYGYNFSGNNGDPMDQNGHGTHCAGVIGASHNSIGVAGVMKDVKIIGVQFLSASGSGETIAAIKSIDYAIKRGVNIMSNSWGGGGSSEALREAIVAANEAGIAFIAAAGNESSNNDKVSTYPANYDVPNVISVGSFTQAGKKSSFSNFGTKSVHVTAPGSSILSTFKDGYSKLSGTSMAAPHVSGVVGLLLSNEPGLTPTEIKERLINTSTKNGKLDNVSVSGGRVDAYRALMNK